MRDFAFVQYSLKKDRIFSDSARNTRPWPVRPARLNSAVPSHTHAISPCQSSGVKLHWTHRFQTCVPSGGTLSLLAAGVIHASCSMILPYMERQASPDRPLESHLLILT